MSIEKKELTILETFEVSKEKEFQQWKEKGLKLIKENPFIEVVDSETYKEAKKRRTNIKTGRTDVEKQDKTLGSAFSTLRKKLKAKALELVSDLKPIEDKQQESIDVWEKKKAEEKLAKQRAEEKRIQDHKDNIQSFNSKIKEHIDSLNIGNSIVVKGLIEDEIQYVSEIEFEEFDVLKDNAVEEARKMYDEKCIELDEARKQAEIQKAKDQELEELRKKEQQRIEIEEKEKKEKERIGLINSTLKCNEDDLNDLLFNIIPSSGSFEDQKQRVELAIKNLENVDFDFAERSEDFKKIVENFKTKSSLSLEKLKKDIEREEEIAVLRKEKEQRESEQLRKQKIELSQKRIVQLLEKGFVESKDDKGFDMWVNDELNIFYSLDSLKNCSEEVWKGEIDNLIKTKKSITDSEERKKRLFSDKNKLEEFVNSFLFSINHSYDNPESKELSLEIIDDIEEVKRKCLTKIENL